MITTLTHSSAISRVGHALSDPTRARILLALRSGPTRSSVLAEHTGVSRQSMSNHLACLRGCGLVTVTRQGREGFYALSDASLVTMLNRLLAMTLLLDDKCCTGSECTC